MASKQKITNKRIAVLAYDGRDWSAYAFRRGKVFSRRDSGSPASIPHGVIRFLNEQGARSIRVLLSGEVRRLETPLPPKLSFNEASALLANEVAEQSGAEAMDLVCAGGSGSLVGAPDPCMLCGAFDRDQIDNLRLQLEQAGLQFDGVGSLELACAAHWNSEHDRETETLVLFGRDHGFVLPARSLPDQPGPLSLSGGLRQVERDAEAWKNRFMRSNRYLGKGKSPSVFAPGAEVNGLAPLLESIEGFPKPEYPEPEALLEGAASQAALGRANQSNSPVPIRNPHVLRKRFSHAFIVIPCLLVLLSPLILWGYNKWKLNRAEENYQAVLTEYAPLEARIEEAEKKKKQTQARFDGAVALQQNLADLRKPMFAFIHLAYFFSKYAGNTVRLDSIEDNGGVIEIRGVYTDPEDGLSLKAELNTFAADKNLRILRNRVAEERDAEGRIFLSLELAVDYQELRK